MFPTQITKKDAINALVSAYPDTSRAALARAIGVSGAYITKVLKEKTIQRVMENQKQEWGGVKPEVVTITPELATEFLKMNTKNRIPDKRSISTYAAAMKEGRWMLNGVPIVISNENILLDGQNRLLACVAANVPFDSLVVWGISPESFKTIDIGKTRTAADILTIEGGIKNSSIVAGSITRYFALKQGLNPDNGNDVNGGIRLRYLNRNRSDVLDFYRQHAATCDVVAEHVASLVNSASSAKLLGASLIGGYELYLILEKGHLFKTTSSFFNQLSTGRNIENETILVLRDALIRHKTKQKLLTGVQRSVYFAKTWNAYVSGKELKVLKFDAERENKLIPLL